MDDDPSLPTAAQHREGSERAWAHARVRHHAQLTEMLGAHGITDAAGVAEVALAAFTEWRDIETGERCRCSCHPQLPADDHHDFGFDCPCTHIRAQRRQSIQKALNEIDEYWDSPDGISARAADTAADRELQTWLTQQPNVTVDGHGGWAPEQWRGEVDGHSFYFRERHDDWHLEIDLHPTGRFLRVVDGRNDDGTMRYRQQAIEHGDIIATGTVSDDGYGATLLERARFIVTTIRYHLTRAACTHHPDKLDAVSGVIGAAARWCAACGARLPATQNVRRAHLSEQLPGAGVPGP